MDNNKFLEEVSRVLKSNGFEVAPFLDNNLPVLLNGEVACRVGSGGALFLRPDDLHSDEGSALYHRVAPFSKLVQEYMNEMERAPVLKASGLDEQFKLLTDYGGAVLAGQEMKKGAGMQFVAWVKWHTPDEPCIGVLAQIADSITISPKITISVSLKNGQNISEGGTHI